MQDRAKKGRVDATAIIAWTKLNRDKMNTPKGEKHHFAKLTKNNIDVIRDLYGKKLKTRNELAKIFAVSRSMIDNIINNKNWKN